MKTNIQHVKAKLNDVLIEYIFYDNKKMEKYLKILEETSDKKGIKLMYSVRDYKDELNNV